MKDSRFTITPTEVTKGGLITVVGPTGTVSTIVIGGTVLAAFGGGGGVQTVLTTAVPIGQAEDVFVADPSNVKVAVGQVEVVDTSAFNIDPLIVKHGDQITITGPVGTVSTIWIGDKRLTAFGIPGAGPGAAATVTADVPPDPWQYVYVAEPGEGPKKLVGAVGVAR